MKNFNMGVHWKMYKGGLPKNGGLRQFVDLRGGLVKKKGVFLRGVDTTVFTVTF